MLYIIKKKTTKTTNPDEFNFNCLLTSFVARNYQIVYIFILILF